MSSPSSSSLLRRICLFRLLPIPFSEQYRPLSAAAAAVSTTSLDSLTAHCNLTLPAGVSARSIRIDESSSEASLAVLSLLRSPTASPPPKSPFSPPGTPPSCHPRRSHPRPQAPVPLLLPTPSHLADLVVANPTLLSLDLRPASSPSSPSSAPSSAPLTRSSSTFAVPPPCPPATSTPPSSRTSPSSSPATSPPTTSPSSSPPTPAPSSCAPPLGVRPDTSLFVHAVRAMCAIRRSTWEARFHGEVDESAAEAVEGARDSRAQAGR